MLGGRPRVFASVISHLSICNLPSYMLEIQNLCWDQNPQQRGLPACIKRRALCQWEYYAPLHCRIQALKHDSGHLQYANTLSVGQLSPPRLRNGG